MKVFSKETHDRLRKVQLIIVASIAAWGALCSGIDLGVVGSVITAVLGACGVFVTTLVENDSQKYFETKTIVGKITPDKKVEG